MWEWIFTVLNNYQCNIYKITALINKTIANSEQKQEENNLSVILYSNSLNIHLNTCCCFLIVTSFQLVIEPSYDPLITKCISDKAHTTVIPPMHLSWAWNNNIDGGVYIYIYI